MNEVKVTAANTMSNMLWKYLERILAQGIAFVLSIILARLIEPGLYGTVALASVVTNLLSPFVYSGIFDGLMQKKDPDDVDYSTVFWGQFGISIVLYAIIFLISPLVSDFYSDPDLTWLIRVSALSLIVGSLRVLYCVYLSKHLQYKKLFYITLSGTIPAAVIGIVLAYSGFGAWAIILQELANNVIDTIALAIFLKWHPKFVFSFKRFKPLFSYGWKMLCSAFLDVFYNNLRTMIIGKKYSSEDLAFYNKGNRFPSLIVENINSSINSVLLPVMASEQDNRDRVRDMTRRAIKTSTYLMMPMMMGLAVCAEPVVRILLTDKWLPCVPYLRIFCFTYAFYPIATANLNAIKALGRSDYFLKLEIIKKAVGLTAVLISMWFGVIWMAYSLIVTSILSQLINSYPNKKLLNYSYANQLKDMLPQILLSLLMGGIVFSISFLPLNDYLVLLIQVPVGMIVYVVGSLVFHIDSFEYILNMLKPYLRQITRKKIAKE